MASRFRSLEDLAANVEYEIELAMQDAIQRALYDLNETLADELRKWLDGFARKFKRYKSAPEDANKEIANEMREAVVEAYDLAHAEHRGMRAAPEDYRVGRGRTGGSALREALDGPATAVGSYQGIQFINNTLLREAASFGRRLNFGSGAGTATLPGIRFTLFGSSLNTPPFVTQKGAPNRMPRGMWFDSSGNKAPTGVSVPSSDTFAPILRLSHAQLSGEQDFDWIKVGEITGWRYLDAGIERFNEVAGPIYEEMILGIVQRASRTRG